MTSTRVIALLGLAVLLAAAAPAGAKTKADLVVKSVKAPASASAGSSFEAIDVVKNAGRKKAGRSAVRFTLSTRSTAGSGGIALTDDLAALCAAGLLAVGVGVLAYRQMDDGRPVPLLTRFLMARADR